MSVEEIKESLNLTDEEWEAIQTPDWELRLRGMAEKATNTSKNEGFRTGGGRATKKKSRRKTASNSKRKNRKK